MSPCECLPHQHDQTVFALLQVYNQSAGDGAISTVKAATDPSLEGQGFKYFGPFYKGPLIIHTGNESEWPCLLRCSSPLLFSSAAFVHSNHAHACF